MSDHLKTYVCFPCKKVAKKGISQKIRLKKPDPVPDCPKCSGKMVANLVAMPCPSPSNEEAWKKYEEKTVEEIQFVSEYSPKTFKALRSSNCAPSAVRIQS